MRRPGFVFARRSGILTAVVLAWMACGWTFSLDPNAYLLLGIPITIAFQRIAAREPVTRAWVFDGAGFKPRKSFAWVGAMLAIVPLAALANAVTSGEPLTYQLWYLVSAAGLLVAVALASAGRAGSVAGWGLALIACVSGSLPFVIGFVTHPHELPPHVLVTLLSSVVMYFGVMFFLEEVTFRGAFDPFLAKAPAGARLQWASAAYVSFLWGIWHFPVIFSVPSDCLSAQGFQVVLFHTSVGLVLSFTARAAGDLVPPAFAHAVIDSVRNALA